MQKCVCVVHTITIASLYPQEVLHLGITCGRLNCGHKIDVCTGTHKTLTQNIQASVSVPVHIADLEKVD